MFDPGLWFLCPVGILIALTGMSAGISSSNFWIPVYMIWLNIEPRVGFWLSLMTMVFGYGSGVVRNIRGGTINGFLAVRYLMICLPAAVLGGVLSPHAPQKLLLSLFAVFVFGYGGFMLLQGRLNRPQGAHHADVFWVRAGLAAFSQGLIATGLGKLIMPCMLKHQRIGHHSEAVGTTVLVVFLSSLAAVTTRLNADFLEVLSAQRDLVGGIMLWVAPSVILGGQIGPLISKRLPERYVRPYVGVLLIGVGCVMIFRVLQG